MSAWKSERDHKMVTTVAKAYTKFKTAVIFCFIGAEHVESQLELIGRGWKFAAWSLQPAEDFNFGRPATVTTVQITQVSGTSFTYSMS